MNITEVVDSILRSPRPTLLIDTCSILDIARLNTRSSSVASLERELRAVDQVIDKLNQDAIWILIAEEVKKELARNKANVFSETKKWAETLQDDLKKLCHLHGNIQGISITDRQVQDVADRLEGCISNLTERALTVNEDADCFMRGSKRNNSRIAPGSAGKEQGDCIIYEHYLECAKLLRQKQFNQKIIYLTSNTSDYCQPKTTTLKAEIASDIETLQIGFVTKWQWCFSQISRS